SERVAIRSVFLRGVTNGDGFAESTRLPGEGTADEPVQDAGAFVGFEIVLEVLVTVGTFKPTRERNEPQAAPKSVRLVAHVRARIRGQDELRRWRERELFAVEVPGRDGVTPGQGFDPRFIELDFAALAGRHEAFSFEGREVIGNGGAVFRLDRRKAHVAE